MLILGDMMIFAIFFGVYSYYRSLDPVAYASAQAQLSQSYGLINTLLLLASSWFVAVAVQSAREGEPGLVTRSYGDLRKRVGQVALGLYAHGFEPGDAIALYMPMTADCVAAYLGIVLAGCRVVSIADSFSPKEVTRRLEIGGARGIVTVDCLIRAGKRIPLYSKVIEVDARSMRKEIAAHFIDINSHKSRDPTPQQRM